MVLSVTLNPCVDHALFLHQLVFNDTNRVTRTERDAGGKGVNVSRVVAELGGATTATGFLGGGAGAYVQAVLTKQGVTNDFVPVAGETRTNFSVEDDSGKPPTTFNERGPEISKAEWDALLKKCSELAHNAKWATLGGSLPPGVPIEAFEILGKLFSEAGCRVMLDADGEALRLGLNAKPHFVKPNHKECSRLLGCPVNTLEEALSACDHLQNFLAPGGFAVISRGADGAVLFSEDGRYVGTSPKIIPHSTIGSGDSLIGGLLWALEDGLSLPDAFQWGLAAGAATALTDGSEIARRPVIEHLLPEATVVRV